jgi:hypothetical protein
MSDLPEMPEMPAEWFVDDQRPQVGEIWEDAEGVFYCIAPAFGVHKKTGQQVVMVWAFAQDSMIPLAFDSVSKPLARAFDVNGNFLLERPLRYPGGSNILRKD